MNPEMPILYILMRTDLESMNAGKGMAQASHAASVFHEKMQTNSNTALNDLFDEWKKSTQHFGTVLVLDAGNHDQMLQVTEIAKFVAEPHEEVFADVVLDPTYPVKDGEVTWHLPVETCAFVFCRHKFGKRVLGKLNLHK